MQDDFASGTAENGRTSAVDRATVVSHEIRGPVGVMMTLSEMLLRRSLEAEDRHLVEMIRLAGHHVLAVADDLIAEASIDATALRIVPSSFAPESLATRITDLWRPLADSADRRLVLEIAPDTPGSIVSDEARVRQILFNLVSNATKATRVGTVTIAVGPSADGGVVFEVRDEGIGLPADFRMEPFAVGHRSHSGSGLGLWISSRIARLLSAELVLEPAPGGGTVARLTVPPAPVPGTAEPASDANASDEPDRRGSAGDRRKARRRTTDGPSKPKARKASSPLAGRRALVVDDSSVSRMLLDAVLGSFGMTVVSVPDGEGAAHALADGGADVILLDWSLGRETGDDVLQRLTDAFGDAVPPVVAVTAATRLPVAAGALVGAVRKPFTPREMFDALVAAVAGTALVETAG